MSAIFTKHARRRAKQRSLSDFRIRTAQVKGHRKYLGGGKYKSTKTSGGKSVTVVYKKNAGKSVIITSWKR